MVTTAATAATVVVGGAVVVAGQNPAPSAVDNTRSTMLLSADTKATTETATVAPVSDSLEQVDAAALVKAAGLAQQALEQAQQQAKAAQLATGAAALRAALTKMNMPYVWGATGPNSFDCSGLVQWAYQQVGVSLPRTTYDQVNVGSPVSKANLQPGDLVFSYADNHHVGIYAGDGKVLNAFDAGDVVRYSELSQIPFNTARRI
ncbi:MAG: NlpC/P60 family protein [Pseudonocardia sp.]|nr:NlpC/P60 family protein [Pseudonocardia sp.]